MRARSSGSSKGWRRVAAIVSIVTLIAALGLVIIATAASLGGVLMVLVGVLIVVGGGWHAVSRRGPVRTISVLVAVVGVVIAVTGLVIGDFSIGRGITIVLLSAISVGTARVALHRTDKDLAATVSSLPSAPPASRPVLIMNPRSGGGKVGKFHLEDECRSRGIEPVVLSPGDDLLALAEDAIARGADVIGMAGGDGSQALVASVASKHDVPHVVIPAGTRNHFALDLGLDRDDVVGALDAYGDGVERRIDLASVNGTTFVNNASMGLYAKIVQSPEYRDAKVQTVLDMLPDLLGPDAVPLDLRYVGPDGEQQDSAHMLLVSNDPYQLDGGSGRGTRVRLDAGTLGVVSLRVKSAAEAQQIVALDAVGKINRFSGWLEWSAERFQVDSGASVEVGVDGEALMMSPPLVFESQPGALRVRIPRHALGASPAARATSPLAFEDLVQVALGRSSG
ncbi:MAG TPA: diacylglycerol kinase family protein [Actinomycetota bacterium]|nr:diacylglycerol kinase family protein [Actinomycetota bacterium]